MDSLRLDLVALKRGTLGEPDELSVAADDELAELLSHATGVYDARCLDRTWAAEASTEVCGELAEVAPAMGDAHFDEGVSLGSAFNEMTESLLTGKGLYLAVGILGSRGALFGKGADLAKNAPGRVGYDWLRDPDRLLADVGPSATFRGADRAAAAAGDDLMLLVSGKSAFRTRARVRRVTTAVSGSIGHGLNVATSTVRQIPKKWTAGVRHGRKLVSDAAAVSLEHKSATTQILALLVILGISTFVDDETLNSVVARVIEWDARAPGHDIWDYLDSDRYVVLKEGAGDFPRFERWTRPEYDRWVAGEEILSPGQHMQAADVVKWMLPPFARISPEVASMSEPHVHQVAEQTLTHFSLPATNDQSQRGPATLDFDNDRALRIGQLIEATWIAVALDQLADVQLQATYTVLGAMSSPVRTGAVKANLPFGDYAGLGKSLRATVMLLRTLMLLRGVTVPTGPNHSPSREFADDGEAHATIRTVLRLLEQGGWEDRTTWRPWQVTTWNELAAVLDRYRYVAWSTVDIEPTPRIEGL